MKVQKQPFREDKIITWTNDTAETVPLMQFVAARRPDVKRTELKKWLKFGYLRVNGKVSTQFDTSVGPGVTVEFNASRPWVVFRHPRIKVVYEDDHVIVIHKGYGLLSVPTESHRKEENAFDILKNYIKAQDPRRRLYIVHRLDRDTSGLMMFAKSEEAQDVLRHNWNNIILERLYVAVLEGYLEEDHGYVKSRLTENSQFVVYSTDEPDEGRIAVTHYDVLERGRGYTLAQFSLDTGRKNQIRVHAHDLGHPITGDRKYGAKHSPIHRLALHARTLRFAHPITRKDMNFSTPIPPQFLSAVGKKHLDTVGKKHLDNQSSPK